MDEVDGRLIAVLRRDARATVSQLAAELGVSRATVRHRMQRLEAAEEILGYTVVLKSDREASPVRGLMLIAIEGQGTDRVVERLARVPEVAAVHSTNGRWDLIVELRAETLAAFDDVLRRIRLIEGIASSETNLLLATRRGAGLGG
ncbi:MAG: Lrp/AsnC family transcriptional regulator [Pseudomonadota bacterium]